MAGVCTRSMARLLTTLSTTPILRAPVTSTRTIVSFKGLQNLCEPGRIPTEETENTFFLREHLEVLSMWHETAEKMRELRLTHHEEDIADVSVSEQVVDLMQELMDENILNPYTGWNGEMHA